MMIGLFLLILPVTSLAASAEDVLTDGKPVGETMELDFSVNDKLKDTQSVHSIHGCSYQELDNGYIRISVEYTMPEGLDMYIFNPPSGKKISIRPDAKTTSERSALQFDINETDLLSVESVAINFHTDDRNRCFVHLVTADVLSDKEPFFPLTEGNPIGEVYDVETNITDQITVPHEDIEVRSYQFQQLDNGYIRFTVIYNMPQGMTVSVVDTAGTKVNMVSRGKTKSGIGTLQFDLQETFITKVGGINVNFYDNTGSYSAFCQTYNLIERTIKRDLTADMVNIPVSSTITVGEPVGRVYDFQPIIWNELKNKKNAPVIHEYKCQELDNENVRFTMEYTAPAGLNIYVFNPPDGDIIHMEGDEQTTSERSILQFEINKGVLAGVKEINVNFYTDHTNRYFVFVNLEESIWQIWTGD